MEVRRHLSPVTDSLTCFWFSSHTISQKQLDFFKTPIRLIITQGRYHKHHSYQISLYHKNISDQNRCLCSMTASYHSGLESEILSQLDIKNYVQFYLLINNQIIRGWHWTPALLFSPYSFLHLSLLSISYYRYLYQMYIPPLLTLVL